MELKIMAQKRLQSGLRKRYSSKEVFDDKVFFFREESRRMPDPAPRPVCATCDADEIVPGCDKIKFYRTFEGQDSDHWSGDRMEFGFNRLGHRNHRAAYGR